MGITPGEIALDRADQALWLPDLCTRSRPVLSDDGRGGQIVGTPDTRSYACRLAPTTGREAEVAARLVGKTTLTVTLPHDADVRAEDTLTVGARTLHVVAVLRGGAWQTALRVLAVEVT
jgi:SPP1 family predicted phage head-tail adaptor